MKIDQKKRRVGILGFGFMGRMHFRCLQKQEGVEVVALCDVEAKNFAQDSGPVGNIAGAEGAVDLSGVALYEDFRQMLAEAQLDALSITLPTFLHEEAAVEALRAGVEVLCEKPMALEVEAAERMAAVAREEGRLLQIGHCIRFWPEYAKAAELVRGGEFGQVRAVSLRRLSPPPYQSPSSWLASAQRSGSAILDLHIHDSDFVNFLLGMPQAVQTTATRSGSGAMEHAVTQYLYKEGPLVVAEGGWSMARDFPFTMEFEIQLEGATLAYSNHRDPTLKLYRAEGGVETPEVEVGDGYEAEIRHFVELLEAGRGDSEVVPVQSAIESLRLVRAEMASAEAGQPVALG